MSMAPDAAWRLVNALTDAARRHEQEALLGSHEGYSNAVQNENRAERAIVAALTGLSHERAELHRPDESFVTGPDIRNADDERQASRYDTFTAEIEKALKVANVA